MKRGRQTGFTLLEVLIAAVLIGSVFVAVVSLMSQSLRNIDRMQPHERAILHAREKMNEQLVSDQLEPGSTAGQWPDGYRWTVAIEPLDFEAMGRSTAPPQPVPTASAGGNPTVKPGAPVLFRVQVQVSWGERDNARTYDLQTMQWAVWPAPKS